MFPVGTRQLARCAPYTADTRNRFHPATRPLVALSALMPMFPLMLVCLSGCGVGSRAAIEITPIELSTPDGLARGYVAEVDLTSERVQILVTRPLGAEQLSASALPTGTQALLETTSAWATREGATLAINANYFGWLGGKKSGEPAKLIGLSVSDGVVVSPARVHNAKGDPALVFDQPSFDRPTHAMVRSVSTNSNLVATHAVAGVGSSDLDSFAGSFLVTSGRNTGDQARVDPQLRHPRTAAGVKDDGHTLVLCVFDGRQPTHSVGVTLPELADVLIDHGVVDAINLDGGGSTSLALSQREGEPAALLNRPSDPSERPVANHLGVRVRRRRVPKGSSKGSRRGRAVRSGRDLRTDTGGMPVPPSPVPRKIDSEVIHRF